MLRILRKNGQYVRSFSKSSASFSQSTAELRRSFVRFFEDKGHTHVPSSSVTAEDDPTLLFTNAGMNQFKSLFLGNDDGRFTGLQTAVNYQKCIRAGGKHNDLEDVGKDLHHQTFFEMLGNWSFNDAYDKKAACEYAWEFLTSTARIDPSRLYISYFGGKKEWGVPEDRETRDIWRKIGVPDSRILPFVHDNFWEMGAVGPCGPCTEIHYDRIPGRKDAESLVNRDDSIVEIWNLVFMSFLRDSSGQVSPLPSLHVDTGMGLERLASIVQNVDSNYDTDAFTPILKHIKELSRVPAYGGKLQNGDPYGRDAAYRVIADHIRAVTIALADGIPPGPTDAGFIVRKMLRRAFRQSVNTLNMDRGSMTELVPTVIQSLKCAYPYLESASDWIQLSVIEEEAQYWRSMDKAKKHFVSVVARLPENVDVISGNDAWTLHDTHGLPLSETILLAEEMSLKVDVAGYERAKKAAKEQSQQASSFSSSLFVSASDFPTHSDTAKYDYTIDEKGHYVFPTINSRVLAIFDESGARVKSLNGAGNVILENCQFYAEEGGQRADEGVLRDEEGHSFKVQDVQKVNGVSVLKGIGQIKENMEVEQRLDTKLRLSTMRAHSATHLLNWALRRTGIGEGQRGSSVGMDYLRFDYTTGENAGEEDSMEELESLIGTVIAKKKPLIIEDMELEKAKNLKKLQSEFRTDKAYPSVVRVSRIGRSWDDSIAVECCSGTHVLNTSSIGDVAILTDKSTAKGMRRIIAVTGEKARECRKYGADVVSELRKIKQAGADLKKVEQFRKGIAFDKLAYGDSKYINSQLRDLKKAMKKTKKVKIGA